MMNFLNNMNLIPKNFIIANIVDTLKDNPEEGAEKIFEMADKFVKDPGTVTLLEQVKDAYYTRPAIRMYTKNLIYNTEKSCLTNFLQNVVVKELLEGLSKREQFSQKYQVDIPHGFILNMSETEINEIDRLIGQGRDLGIHLVILTNDDKQLLKTFEKYSDVQFLVLTNGESLSTKRCEMLAELGNVFPMVINEENINDFGHLKSSGLLYGMITPTTPNNFKKVTSDMAVLPEIRQGSRLNWYVTSDKEMLEVQKIKQLKQRIDEIRQTRPYLTLHLETNQFLNQGGLIGDLLVEETVNGREYRLKFPMVNGEKSKGKNLIQILKNN